MFLKTHKFLWKAVLEDKAKPFHFVTLFSLKALTVFIYKLRAVKTDMNVVVLNMTYCFIFICSYKCKSSVIMLVLLELVNLTKIRAWNCKFDKKYEYTQKNLILSTWSHIAELSTRSSQVYYSSIGFLLEMPTLHKYHSDFLLYLIRYCKWFHFHSCNCLCKHFLI